MLQVELTKDEIKSIRKEIKKKNSIFKDKRYLDSLFLPSNIIGRRKQAKKILEYFESLQTRDFVAIDDVINLMYNAISYGKSGTCNISSGRIVTIKELAELMISISGKKLEIQYTAAKKGDIKYSQADISLAKKVLAYSPKLELDRIKELLE